jgi:hypothetical protein
VSPFITCQGCGEELNAEWVFCPSCGAESRTGSTPEDGRGGETPRLWHLRQSFVGSALAGQSRFVSGLLWAGILMGLFGAFTVQGAGGGAVAVFLIPAGLCAVGLVVRLSMARDLERTLPDELAALWYRTGVASVAVRWRWQGGVATTVRLLRSPTFGARFPEAHVRPGSDQVLVYEGSDDHVLDVDVESGATYHYTLWVRDDEGDWRQPVRLLLTALNPPELKHIEATYQAAPVGVRGLERRSALGKTLAPDELYDPHGTDVEWARAMGDAGVLSIAAHAMSDVLTDGIFAAADLLPEGELERSGWVRVR